MIPLLMSAIVPQWIFKKVSRRKEANSKCSIYCRVKIFLYKVYINYFLNGFNFIFF